MNKRLQKEQPILLLVDDDPSFCQTLSRALERRSLAVIIAHNCLSALHSLEHRVPDYALIDLRLEGESGLALIENLRAITPGTRIVVLTGYASVATAVEAVKLGAIYYLMKPADPDEIVAAFHRDGGNPEVSPPAKPMSSRRLEWEHIQRVLRAHHGNISAAARALGMHRRTLQRKLQKWPVRV